MTLAAAASNRAVFAGTNPKDFALRRPRCRRPIQPGLTAAVTVAFHPKDGGQRNATLTINSNDPAGPLTVNLRATADRLGEIEPRGPAPTRWPWTAHERPGRRCRHRLRLGRRHADGGQDLHPQEQRLGRPGPGGRHQRGVTIGGAGAAYYSVSAAPPRLARPGPSTTFSVAFAPAGQPTAPRRTRSSPSAPTPPTSPPAPSTSRAWPSRAPLAQVTSGGHTIPTGDTKPLTLDNTDFGGANTGLSVLKNYTINNIGSGNLHLGDTNGATVVVVANGTNVGASDSP